MEVLPRIKTVPQVGSVLHNPAHSVVEILNKKEETVIDVESDDTESPKRAWGTTVILIIIFATIIVILVVVIVWLVTKNDKYLSWLRGSKHTPRAPPPTAHVVPDAMPAMSHSDIIYNTSADELAMFANMTNAPVKQAVEIKPDTALIIVDIDAKLENDLNAKLDSMEKDTVEISPTLAIDEAVDAEIAKVEAEQNKPIEQLNFKNSAVLQTFTNSESVYNANFDYDQVVLCCRGEIKSHKKFRWRYKPTDNDVLNSTD